MIIKELNQKPGLTGDAKATEAYLQFEKLLTELRNRELPDEIVVSVNREIDDINATQFSGKDLVKQLKTKKSSILKLLEKEMKLVPKHYYMSIWMAVGMAAFGVPIGVALGLSLDNMAFIGIGLPIGMPIGMAIGVGMDKKASDEGRQLDLQLK